MNALRLITLLLYALGLTQLQGNNLNSESHGTYFKPQKKICVDNSATLLFSCGGFRKIELFKIAHTSKFYLANQPGALKEMETSLCWHVKTLR